MQLSITRVSHIQTTYIAKYLHCKINLKNSPSRIGNLLRHRHTGQFKTNSDSYSHKISHISDI